MPIRNRGEIIRLILEESGVPYEVEVVGYNEWKLGVKGTSPHGKCPVLRNFDGRGNDLCQEQSIMRFLASSLGLSGDTPATVALVDSMHALWFSTMRNNGVSHSGEHYSVEALKASTHSELSEAPPYEDMLRVNDLTVAQRSFAALRFFEGALERSGTAFLVGEGITYADLGLFYTLYELMEEDNVPDFAERFGLPRLGEFVETVAARPRVAEFLRSETRMPRYGRAKDGSSTYVFIPGRESPVRI